LRDNDSCLGEPLSEIGMGSVRLIVLMTEVLVGMERSKKDVAKFVKRL